MLSAYLIQWGEEKKTTHVNGAISEKKQRKIRKVIVRVYIFRCDKYGWKKSRNVTKISRKRDIPLCFQKCVCNDLENQILNQLLKSIKKYYMIIHSLTQTTTNTLTHTLRHTHIYIYWNVDGNENPKWNRNGKECRIDLSSK